VVDLFCASVSPEQKLSLDRFDVVKKKLHELTGRLFLVEIAEAFISMIQEEILKSAASSALGQIMILGDNVDDMQSVELRLRNEGFRVVCETSQDSFAEMFERSEPDVLLVISTQNPGAITKLIDKVVNPKSLKAKVPVFLLVREYHTAQLAAILGKNVEDIISLDNNLDIMVSKLRSILAVLNKKPAKMEDYEEYYGATGRLRNMSLIDLLQATGPGQKTIKITVTRHDKNQKLEMFLDKGKIIYAKVGNFKGAEAVYEAMAWSDGVWSMEPIDSKNLPQPNNSLSNESILIEGCRLLDEKARASQII
jgi:CheY-like chemotaxis protein